MIPDHLFRHKTYSEFPLGTILLRRWCPIDCVMHLEIMVIFVNETFELTLEEDVLDTTICENKRMLGAVVVFESRLNDLIQRSNTSTTCNVTDLFPDDSDVTLLNLESAKALIFTSSVGT